MEKSRGQIENYLKTADNIKNALYELNITNLNKKFNSENKTYTIDSIDFEENYIVLFCERIDENGDNQSYFTEFTFDEFKDKFSI